MPYKDPLQQAKAQRESFLRNQERYRRNNRDRRIALRKKVDGIKITMPCADCGVIYPPFVTDFHHRDPSEKDQEVSRLVGDKRSMTRILAEIEKCDLLCANCHRTREYQENERFRV